MKLLRLFVLLSLSLLIPSSVRSEPFGELRIDGILITLHTEACTLPEVVNLPGRTEWVENGKTIEGCWSINPRLSIVVMYFADKTVATAPMQAFHKVSNI